MSEWNADKWRVRRTLELVFRDEVTAVRHARINEYEGPSARSYDVVVLAPVAKPRRWKATAPDGSASFTFDAPQGYLARPDGWSLVEVTDGEDA